MITLRPYQAQAIAELRAAWSAGARRLLLVSRTGTGKSVIAAAVLASVVARGGRAVFVVRDRTLLGQTSQHLAAIGLEHGVIAAGCSAHAAAPVQVCSVGTLTSRGLAPPATVLVVDEAHGVLAPTSRAIVERYPEATMLGLTATPERGDGQPLGDVFERLVQVRATFAELVALGALVPCRVLAPAKEQRGLAQNPIDVLRTLAPLGSNHKPVIFGSSRVHARALAAEAAALGYRAAMVDGETPDAERADAFRRFMLPAREARALDLLTNVDVLVQGWDCPPADVGILAQGSATWGAWIQKIGRFLRPCPERGKKLATIADLRGSVWAHGLPSDDREFSLAAGETGRRGVLEALPPVVCCTNCLCWHRGGGVCPACGTASPEPKAPPVRAADLIEVRKTEPETRKRAELEQIVRREVAAGRSPWRASHVYRGRFGEDPPREWIREAMR